MKNLKMELNDKGIVAVIGLVIVLTLTLGGVCGFGTKGRFAPLVFIFFRRIKMDNEYVKILDQRILKTKELLNDFRYMEEVIENEPDEFSPETYIMLRKYIYDLEDKLEDLKGRKMTFLNCQNPILEGGLK